MATTVTLSDALKELFPAANSTSNDHVSDVVGNKTDTVIGNSLYAAFKRFENHIHGSSCVAPSLQPGVALTAGTAWVLGAAATIIDADVIDDWFDIHFINVEALSATATYEIVLYGDDVEIARMRVTKTAAQDTADNCPVQTQIQPAGTKISAKVASSSPGATATISIYYHKYDI